MENVAYGAKSLLYIRDRLWCLGVFFSLLMNVPEPVKENMTLEYVWLYGIQIYKIKMQTESFCSWSHDGHGQRENWAAKLDRKGPREIFRKLNNPPRKEQNKSKTFLLFFF